MLPFLALLLAHLITDFLQPELLVRWAKQSIFGVFIHTIIYALLSAFILVGYGRWWWFWLIVLTSSHFILDFFKYHLSDIKSSFGSLHILIADQLLHVGVLVLVVVGGGLAKLDPSPFLSLVSNYWQLLPSIVGYIAGTFVASIFIFEAGRAFNFKSASVENNGVATFKDRALGIIERTLAITFFLTGLYYLIPFSFTVSIYQLIKKWKTNRRRKFAIEFGLSVICSIATGYALIV